MGVFEGKFGSSNVLGTDYMIISDNKVLVDSAVLDEMCIRDSPITQQAVDAYQLEALRRQASYVVEHSRFYRQLYAGYDLDDPLSLPLISSEDIVAAGTSVVCLSQSRIKRIVTMMTSGSTAAPKRIYFSEADLELTIDFFANGMLFMTAPGERVMICMDGQPPDGLGDLLRCV